MARACGQAVLGKTPNTGTHYIECMFEISVDENERPAQVRWTGWFGPKSAERTIEALQYCGWQGDDVGEFADGELHGLDTNEVEIVVVMEEYEKDGDKKTAPIVKWVNKPGGGGVNVKNAMPKAEAESFGSRMRGLVLKAKQKTGTPSDADTEFNHGANQKKASGEKPKGW
jgi:hypothetical protein